MAIYTKCLLCDSRVTDICGKVYHARGKEPPCANAVVENVNSAQQLKAEIRALLKSYDGCGIGDISAIDGAC
ncbi:hypothetical protein Q3368_15405, partial [Listeria monocytogenes]|uniref:hypothetical protein n=1 Tax=Listeria monocytogenes TaxID=1639 RepID=UPI002B249B20